MAAVENRPAQPADTARPAGRRLDLDAVVAGLRQTRERWREQQGRLREPGGRELPSRELLAGIVEGLRGALFPMRLGPPDLRPESEDYYVGHQLDTTLGQLRAQVRLELRHEARTQGQPTLDADARAQAVVHEFALALPRIRSLLDSDVLAAFHGDPAARSVDEVLLCYPGVRALISHRLAHQLHRQGVPLLARVIAELSHGETGIDIHPGAQIGPGFFIDHGTGVVIGETTEIGRGVRLYQAVTLGAKRFEQDAEGHLVKGGPRHPVVEDEAVIYAGATILGRVTIGRGSVIGGNVWLTHSVPAGSHITQAGNHEGQAPRSPNPN
ncbi:serine O-acetyltransferase EpsC [Pseudorhodoferax sp.]|uniref:serine O-acetyltransferase EpsC n=1 Tax=Pseudorhodoferax sp. TaxID=1993553 RepID=UPI002DD6AEC4|nr:serine O-acetyltransferase EpsC [Pseudorhodoferax sp.]